MQKEKVIISYAYNGLIYFPLLLAERLKYFPPHFELRFADGDENALKQLTIDDAQIPQSHIAVCDPLIFGNPNKFSGYVETGSQSEIKVIGAFIQKPPMWLFNDSTIEPVEKEADLIKHAGIHKVRFYEPPNTGYLIGKRLMDMIGIKDSQTNAKAVKFNEEFNQPVDPDEIIVTSNILRIAEIGFGKKNIVFSYPSKVNGISKLLFTGVLARKDVLDNNLTDVISFLNGLKKAIGIAYSSDLDQLTNEVYEIYKSIITDNNLLSKEYPEDKIRTFLHGSLSALRREKIYSEDLVVSRKGWSNISNLRRKYMSSWHSPSLSSISEKLPLLFLKNTWRKDITHYSTRSVIDKILNFFFSWNFWTAAFFIGFLGVILAFSYLIYCFYMSFSSFSSTMNIVFSILLLFGFTILLSHLHCLFEHFNYNKNGNIAKVVSLNKRLITFMGIEVTFIFGLLRFYFGANI